MYAIIRSGGKQAKVAAGDIIDVELLGSDTGKVTFTPLLVVDDRGSAVTDGPDLARLQVTAKVLGEVKGKKVNVFKYKNKSGYRRRQGHRQRYTRLEITNIGSAHSEEA
jgi:large subunit ribosomal protein L21